MRTDDRSIVDEIIAEHRGVPGATLVILLGIQERLGYVPETAIPQVAAALNLSRAEVHGVVTFYHDLRHEPAGRHVVRLCRAEACQAAGGRALAEEARRSLGVDFGETTADGRVSLEAVYCLGLCATGPAATIDERPVGRLGSERLRALLAEATA